MPGFHIHLAIGKRYIEKNKVDDQKEFLKGIIAPDFAESKDKSHYSITKHSKDNLVEYLKNKVDIYKFLKENKIETDYEKGVFLHLLTDKIFFEEFFDEEYLMSVDYKTFTQDLYYSYNITNSYLQKKYNIVFSKEEEEKIKNNIEQSRKLKQMDDIIKGQNILPIDKLEEFIEKMSDVNLNDIEKFGYSIKTTKNKNL